ncbi:hypothetical protein QAD02_010795 [Eretmocerus hayati]|uniref:Uncharacterized protein n=1 Tax=Eretmocerus hayati TaxID=131215 RepID=A0ACC2NUS7_9HYME|nr:hypothetical protein QAD02_010795 [Eretmocerus hayati]
MEDIDDFFDMEDMDDFPSSEKLHEMFCEQSTSDYIFGLIRWIFHALWYVVILFIMLIALFLLYIVSSAARKLYKLMKKDVKIVQNQVTSLEKIMNDQRRELDILRREILDIKKIKQFNVESHKKEITVKIDSEFKARLDHMEKTSAEVRKKVQTLETHRAENESEAKQILKVNSEWKNKFDQQLTEMKKKLHRFESIQKQCSEQNEKINSEVKQNQETICKINELQSLLDSNHELQKNLDNLKDIVESQAEQSRKDNLELKKKLEQKILDEATRMNCSLGHFSALSEKQAQKSANLVVDLRKQLEVMSQEFSSLKETFQSLGSDDQERNNNDQNKHHNGVIILSRTFQNSRAGCDTT